MIRWGIKVNKSGCLKCTKSHKALPRNLMSLISRGRFNFALREKYIAKQINEAIRNCEGHKSFVGLYEDHMLYGILKHICNLNSEEEVVLEGSSTTVDMSQDKNETLFKHFLTKENQTERFKSATMKKEFTEKFSMILSILSLSDRKM